MKLVQFISAMLILAASAAQAQSGYFKDDFSWGYNNSIWQARSGSNGSPFGCSFAPGMINPSSHGITLTVSPGQCAELRTRSQLNYGRIQSSLKTGNTAGTVSSILPIPPGTMSRDGPGRKSTSNFYPVWAMWFTPT